LKVFLEEEYPAIVTHLMADYNYYRSEFEINLLEVGTLQLVHSKYIQIHNYNAQYFPTLLQVTFEKLKPLFDTLETHTNENIIKPVWNKLFGVASLAFKNERLR